MRKQAAHRAECLSFCLIVALSLTSTATASKNGASSMYSGGVESYEFGGGNCTACHMPDDFGPGEVRLLNAPSRYRAGNVYDMLVRVSDPEQAGAGFQLSAEGDTGHIGRFLIRDALRTQNAESFEPIEYVTHTRDGRLDSIADWAANGGYFYFQIRWQAPYTDDGPVTFFVSGNAINDATSFQGDRYYSTWATAGYSVPGDADGDEDLDLTDFAAMQRCFSGSSPYTNIDCGFLDFESNGFVTASDVASMIAAMSGPTAPLPADYVLADAVRGGLLYDKWWLVAGVSAPQLDHPLWQFRPDIESNDATGSSTWRCKECHGWDYKGVDGAYAFGSHRTGFPGVFGSTLTAREMFQLLTESPDDTPNGHDLRAAGLSDEETWHIVKAVSESLVDTDIYIAANKEFIAPSPNGGQGDYFTLCASCHDDPNAPSSTFGTNLDFGDEHIGGLARRNPWEFLHKIRFGHPATPMPALDLLRWDVQRATNLAAFASTPGIFPD